MRDTSFDRSQHEATGKHQGALKRFLRDIHREKERGERVDDRAKNEIERLRGLVSGGDKAATTTKKPAAAPAPSTPAATLAERKQQIAQLAEMGVAIPDEFRKEMAMVGDWTVVSETVEEDEAKKSAAEAAKLNVGVRKRKIPEGEVEEEATVVRKGWGSKFKRLPEDEEDLDTLLAMTTSLSKKKRKEGGDDEVDKSEEELKEGIKGEDMDAVMVKKESPGIEEASTVPEQVKTEAEDGAKKEETGDVSLSEIPEASKESSTEDIPTVVFKKRKAKQIRR